MNFPTYDIKIVSTGNFRSNLSGVALIPIWQILYSGKQLVGIDFNINLSQELTESGTLLVVNKGKKHFFTEGGCYLPGNPILHQIKPIPLPGYYVYEISFL